MIPIDRTVESDYIVGTETQYRLRQIPPMTNPSDRHSTPDDRSAGPSEPPPVWSSDELLGAADEVLIQHGSDVYRLRRTRQGKLILYK